MKYLPLFLLAAACAAQTSVPKDTVVAKVGSQPVTAGDIQNLMARLPEDLRRAFLQNPKNALHGIAVMDFLANEGEKSKAAEASPYREQLNWHRRQVVAQAEAARRQAEEKVTDEEARKVYDADPAKFDVARIRMIYIAFTDAKAAKPVTEAEALAKAEDVVKQARTGMDFGELARLHSEDKRTTSKGGESGMVRKSDALPPELKQAIFSFPKDRVTDPVKQGQGFYVVKIDDLSTQKFEDVRDQIASTIRQERFQKWMQGVQKQYEVTIENPDFFKLPAAAAPPAK